MRSFTSKTVRIPAPGSARRAILLQPRTLPRAAAGILWLHGGGYLTGMADMVYFSRALPLVRDFGAVVLAPDYRLSWRHPYPAALEDAEASLYWLQTHATALGVDPALLMVGGESAGGGLTAALCLRMRSKGDVPIALQMPLYPMLDCRETATSADNHDAVWNTARNKAAWKKYLRSVAPPYPPCAVPALAEDLSGLPPAYTFISRQEPFYAETSAYIEKLHRSGVPARMDVWDGPHHAFDMLRPGLPVSRMAAAVFNENFAAALASLRQDGEVRFA